MASSSTPPETREQTGFPAAVVSVVPYVLLVLLAGVTAVIKGSPGSLAIDLGLCALAALWMLAMYTLHPAWRTRPGVMGVFVAGLVAVLAVLVIRDPWFGFFAPAGYVYAFRLLVWPWRLAGVGAVAVLAGMAQASSLDLSSTLGVVAFVAVVVLNVLPMCGFAWADWHAGVVNAERVQALEEVSEANHRLETTLAENAGLQKQLLVQAREAGVLDERQRMAREIHDTLAQGLTGIVTQLQAAEQAAADPDGWRRHFASATRLARESLSEARRSVDALRPEPLESARLSDAVAGVAERWSTLNEIPVQVTTTGEPRTMTPDAEVALLRTAQEALANVAKYAQATRVGVTLSYLDAEVVLDVRDDGVGFDPGRAARDRADGGTLTGGGFGLIAMRQRIEALSGSLEIESEPGGGTAISASVPFTPVEART
jgi:signal transduction histidine kinase